MFLNKDEMLLDLDDLSDEEDAASDDLLRKDTEQGLSSQSIFQLSMDLLHHENVEKSYRNKKKQNLSQSKFENSSWHKDEFRRLLRECLLKVIKDFFSVSIGGQVIEKELSSLLFNDFKELHLKEIIELFAKKPRSVLKQLIPKFPVKETEQLIKIFTDYIASLAKKDFFLRHKFTFRLPFTVENFVNNSDVLLCCFEKSRDSIGNAIACLIKYDKEKYHVINRESGKIANNQNSNTGKTLDDLAKKAKDPLEIWTYLIIKKIFLGTKFLEKKELDSIAGIGGDEKRFHFVPEALNQDLYKMRYAFILINLWMRKELNRGSDSIIESGLNGDEPTYFFKFGVDNDVIKNSEIKSLLEMQNDIFLQFLPYDADQFREKIREKVQNLFASFYSSIKEKFGSFFGHFERNTLPQQFSFSSSSTLDFFSNLRLASVSELRRIKELGKPGARSFGAEVVQRNWLFSNFNPKYGALESQEITSNHTRSDKILNLGSYKKIYYGVLKLKAEAGLHDGDIALYIRNILKANLDILDKKLSLSCQKFLIDLTQLLFGTEVVRHPSCLIIHQMVLDLLIAKAEGISLEKLFTGGKDKMLPVAMSKKDAGKSGAVSGARYIHSLYGKINFRYRHFYSFGDESEPVGKIILEKEKKIIELWQKTFPEKNINDEIREWYQDIFSEEKNREDKEGKENIEKKS